MTLRRCSTRARGLCYGIALMWLAVLLACGGAPAEPPPRTIADYRPAAPPPANYDSSHSLPPSAQASHEDPFWTGVRSETDEFTGVTSHAVQVRFGGGRYEIARFATVGQASTALLVLHFDGPQGWRYLECHHVHALADDQRIPLGEADHDGRVGRRGGVSETISIPLDWDALTMITQAQQIRFRVCNDVFTLDPRVRADVYELMRRARPQLFEPPATGSAAVAAEEAQP